MRRMRSLAAWCRRNAAVLATAAGVASSAAVGVILFSGGAETIAAPAPIPAPTTTRPAPGTTTTSTSEGPTTTTTAFRFAVPTTTTIDTSRDPDIATAALLRPEDIGPGWAANTDLGVVDAMFFGGGACSDLLIAFSLDVTGTATGGFETGYSAVTNEARVFGSETWAEQALAEFAADSTAGCLRSISDFGNDLDERFSVERTGLGGPDGAAWLVRYPSSHPESDELTEIHLVGVRRGRTVAVLVTLDLSKADASPSVEDLVAALTSHLP